MNFGTKKVGKAIWGAVKKASPANVAAAAVDKAVDTLKDDEFIVEGESILVVFGFEIGRISHLLRVHVADKEKTDDQ